MDSELLIEMYRRLLRIRYFDEKVLELHSRAEFPGVAHASNRTGGRDRRRLHGAPSG